MPGFAVVGGALAELARPQVPSGAQRELVDALHAAHHQAGWPSLRRLAREAGCSHTTVSAVFSSPRLPSWGVLELLIESMGGDVGEFHRLWLAASTGDSAQAPWPRLAGRRAELATLRRHLQSGTGLLLVTGEAGIGKTRLVESTSGSAGDIFVARGACLPLSAQVPLLPVTDILRSVYEVDQGQWVKMGIAECAPYVLDSLRKLLPELDQAVGAQALPPEDDWWRQRLLSAVGTTLSALASVRPLAVLLEDLHWGDPTTLDLLEYLLSRPPGLPLVATYRLHDPVTPTATREWLGRVRRLSAVTTLELGPLTRDETAELLELLGRAPTAAETDRIHTRTGGLPLFTEQLAAQSSEDEALPGPLVDLLDGRLADISPIEWVIVRALGVADRPLAVAQLRTLTRLPATTLTAGLHALVERRLVTRVGVEDVRLGHPLLAEAVRRRLIGGEATDEHRRLARTLAAAPHPSAAEVAEHWQRADDHDQEITWRIRAAQEAGARWALASAADQWRRALELWPDDAEWAGTPAVHRSDAYLAAIEALEAVDWQAAGCLANQALRWVGDADEPGAAEVYRRAGEIQGKLGNPEAGLELVDRALRVLDATGQPDGRARALLSRALLLTGLDRMDEAAAACAVAIELSARPGNGDPVTRRMALSARAAHDFEAGRLDLALEGIEAAARVAIEEPDPGGDLEVAVCHTHILLSASRSADEVVAAGRSGLEAAAAWGIENHSASVLLGNLSEALRCAGRVREAAALIDPVTEGSPTPHQWATYCERGHLDLLRGHGEKASRLLEVLSEVYVLDLANRAVAAQDGPMADLWCGRPHTAYRRLKAALDDVVAVEDHAVDIAGLLVLAARAAADLADADPDARARLISELENLLARTREDPFSRAEVYAVRRALRSAWVAEMTRLSGIPSVDRWSAAAAEWDEIGRPHESAYCRWRGAQAASALGRGRTAMKLLGRAERDAREHAPLLEAVRTTVGRLASTP